MNNAQDVIETDIDYICTNLQNEFSKMAGENLLIVGGAGFLGYYLVQSIVRWNEVTDKNKIKITVLDNFIRGHPPWLLQLQNNKQIIIHRHNIIESLPVNNVGFNYIIHAASIASPSYYRKFPLETMDANVNGLRNILDHCRTAQKIGKDVAAFLFFSTSEIYGDPDPQNVPTSEDYRGNVSCTGPRACYDESKRYGETLCVNYAKQFGFPVKIARPFNNYGPGLKISDRRIIPDIARNIFANKNIILHSDGGATRTFCYISDAIIGYYKILVNGRAGEAYNVGADAPEISMKILADSLKKIAENEFNFSGKIVHEMSDDSEYLTDNPNRRCPSIKKIKNELGFNPSVQLFDGLRKTLLWYNENRWGEDA